MSIINLVEGATVSAPNPSPEPESGIQANKPPVPDPGIQANRPVGALPPSLAQATFLARLRRLLDMHVNLYASTPKPKLWGMIQVAGIALGVAVGFNVYSMLLEAKVSMDLAAIAFLVMCFVGALLPDLMLKLIARLQRNAAREDILDFIVITVRNYPDEVDHCGGVNVLVDRVELEALVHVLTQTYESEEPPPPPLR